MEKRKIVPYSSKISDYLEENEIVNHRNPAVSTLADTMYQAAGSKMAYIQSVYEYVRDQIPHSADIHRESIPYVASDVLAEKHGVCFAKSHLLAALLRCKSIPTGFCYQKVILNAQRPEILAYHGLNGVYMEELGRWIRLDPGAGGEFSVDAERLVFSIREELGEVDGCIVYPAPDKNVIECFRRSTSLRALSENPPTELFYDSP